MKLPDDLLLRHFDDSLRRGAVVRFKADDLDDPAVQARFKFGVVLSLDPAESDTLYVFTTSKLTFFQQHPHLAGDILMLKAGSYPWCVVDTAVNLREVRIIPRERLRARITSQELTFEGCLSDADLRSIDSILRSSKLIAPAVLHRILPA